MAVANFFDKIALGASQVLKGYDRSEFEKILLSRRILIFFDDNAGTTSEGRATLDLLVRLIARLYPVIQIENGQSNCCVEELKRLALQINPKIEFANSGRPTICVTMGNTSYSGDSTTFYIGSDNWVTRFSLNQPVGSLSSNNPFGAGAAACIGAANVFRCVFQNQLQYGAVDQDFSLSLIDFSLPSNNNDLLIESLYLDEVVLVGLGAIGNGVIWALQRMPNITGDLIIIDDERVALSNLQRYILTDQDSINASKTTIIENYLNESKLTVLPEPVKWSSYVSRRKNWQIETILTCVDSAEDRITIQGALPKTIFNAWTQRENLGVSRHLNFSQSPCLCCLYYPTQIKKGRSQEIADNLNISGSENVIREYLANNLPLDEKLIQLISSANGISGNELRSFLGSSINIFYSEVVCGGILMKLKGPANEEVSQGIDVPLAFESALAGLLLAAELIKNKLGYIPQDSSASIQVNLLRPITSYLNVPEVKMTSCICNDQIFQNIYAKKWGV